MKPTPEQLACEFSKVLRKWLDAFEMGCVIALNRQEKTLHVCHSHDFCDANMAMLEALGNLTGATENQVMGLLENADTGFGDVWNAAWGVAFATEFATEPALDYAI